MIDRLVFEKTKFANGATAHVRRMDAPYTTIYVMIPIGSAHTGAHILPGSPHFLEHLMVGRSRLNPARSEFDLAVGLTGGWTNAHTAYEWTSYELSVPNRHLAELLPRFCSAIFEPLFPDEDLTQQRGVIANERQLEERWWPGQSEIGQYIRTGWQLDDPVGIRRTFGSDEDLAAIQASDLNRLHRQYFDPRIKIVAAGCGDLTPLLDYVEALTLNALPLPSQHERLRWVNQTYHEKAFRDASSYELYYGAILSEVPDPEATCVANFILTYFCNCTHGPLYDWLRNDEGLVYDINWGICRTPWGADWSLSFELNEPSHVEFVRNSLRERMEAAITDTERVRREIERLRDRAEAFDYQLPDSIVDTATNDYHEFGRLVSETEWRRYVAQCADPAYLLAAFHQYFDPAITGSFCAIPIED